MVRKFQSEPISSEKQKGKKILQVFKRDVWGGGNTAFTTTQIEEGQTLKEREKENI